MPQLTIKRAAVAAVIAAVACGVIYFFTAVSVGRAIVFSVQDPGTVNHAASMKADYVKQFGLTASPKGN